MAAVSSYSESRETIFTVAILLYLSRSSVGIAHSNENTDWRVMVRLYRGPLLLVIFLFLMGINVYCWRSSGVNHVLIFELDPRNHLTEQHIMELATVFGLVWAGSALIFLYSEALHIPPYINPLILAVLMIAFLFNPTKTLRHDARFWVLRVAVSDFVPLCVPAYCKWSTFFKIALPFKITGYLLKKGV